MKQQNDENARKHTCAHLLAAAILKLYPDTKTTIGPATEDGFYYDFDFSEPISENELPKIEKEMKKILPTWDEVTSREVTAEEAKKIFENNEYKKELVDEIEARGEKITLFKMGDFEDLCRGGHTQNPKKEIKAFKLLSVAGAYWRGDEKNPMLTRIYGACFASQNELDEYLKMREEAKKRDHRRLGKELDLFLHSPLVGSGLPLWTPKGTALRDKLDEYIGQLRKEKGYQRVTIPHITKKALYEKSGHWEKFADELFCITSREGEEFAMKPMNCPHHTQIFSNTPKSYKEMPQRYCETTMVYRDEQSGELGGLTRVRSITQDDSHVFCRKSQVKEEFLRIWDIVDTFYKSFGFELSVRLSFHDPDQFEKYIGTPQTWKQAEGALEEIAKEKKIEVQIAPGEAAMYGPKVDFVAKDSLGRVWQVATIQLDLNLPERFNLTCINEKGEKERIVMLHAAIMGSIERFLAVLIEHYAGRFPIWLAPVQIAVLPISEKVQKNALETAEELQNNGFRVELDETNETIGSKIRKTTLQKIPLTCIIGEQEVEKGVDSGNKYVSVRTLEGENLGTQDLSDFIKETKEKIEKKS